MYYTDDSLLPENMPPLMITGAPYGPVWMPQDCTPEQKLPVTWEEQTQAAVDCFNAGATLLHIHVRDPKTGHISKNFKEYGEQIARLRKAVPKMILQIGGSISFAPEPGEKAEFGSYDARHKLCEIDPKPDQITVSCGTTLYDHTAINRLDDAWAGTRFTNPAMASAMANLVADATPEFYLENIKRCVQHGIQPCFALATRPRPGARGAADPQGLLQGAGERFLQHGRRRCLRRESVRHDGTGPAVAAWFHVSPTRARSVTPIRCP